MTPSCLLTADQPSSPVTQQRGPAGPGLFATATAREKGRMDHMLEGKFNSRDWSEGIKYNFTNPIDFSII